MFKYRKNYSFSMVTTIQVSDSTKHKLNEIKKRQKVSYDQILQNLLKHEQKLVIREQVAEYYAVHKEDDVAEVNEFKHTETQ